MITSSAEVARRTARNVANDLASLMAKVVEAQRLWLATTDKELRETRRVEFTKRVGDLAAGVTRAGGDSGRLFS